MLEYQNVLPKAERWCFGWVIGVDDVMACRTFSIFLSFFVDGLVWDYVRPNYGGFENCVGRKLE